MTSLHATSAARATTDWLRLGTQLHENGTRHDRDGSFPADNLALLRQEGLLALTVPVTLGGGGAGLARAVETVGDVARGCASTALILAMQLTKQAAIARGRVYALSMRDRIGRDAVAHGALLNAIRVEAELGSPTRGGLPATVARPVPEGWRISGHKIYATGAPGLAWLEVLCRTDEAVPRIGTFLVAAGTPGLRIVENWDHLGLRASGSHDVVLEDVLVPDGQAGQLTQPGADAPLRQDDQAAWNAAMLGGLYTGVAVAARDWVRGFLRERVPANLGAPLATLPRMQEVLGEIEALLEVNARLVAGIAAETDAGAPPPSATSGLLKVVITRQAVEAVRLATTLSSNHAHHRGNPLERHWRDVQCGLVHVPQADSAMVAGGRAALALS